MNIQDIIEMGWVKSETLVLRNLNFFYFGDKMDYIHLLYLDNDDDYNIEIFDAGERIFRGRAENKNDLTEIMRLTRINQNQ